MINDVPPTGPVTIKRLKKVGGKLKNSNSKRLKKVIDYDRTMNNLDRNTVIEQHATAELKKG